jgi:hypothetical protein
VDGYQLPDYQRNLVVVLLLTLGEINMRTFTILSFLCFAVLLLSSCADFENELSDSPVTQINFTTEKIMKIHQGMDSKEILALFGEPKNISVNVCGSAPNQWNCTTWEYGKITDEWAIFTFSEKKNSLRLNNFNIDRKEAI